MSSTPIHDCLSIAGSHSADCQLALARGTTLGRPGDFETRQCRAHLNCGNLTVPLVNLSFRGFCPQCEHEAQS